MGDKGHAEVTGLLGYAEGKGHVVQELDEIELLPPMDKVCVVAQTTQDRRMFKEAIERLKNDIQIVNLLKRSAVPRTNDRMKLST